MNRLLRFLSLDRIVGQITVLLIVASFASFVIVTTTVVNVLSERDYPTSAADGPARIERVLRGLNGLPPDARPAVAAAFSDDDVQIRLGGSRPIYIGQRDDHPLKSAINARVPAGVQILSIQSAGPGVVEVYARLADGQEVAVLSAFSRLSLLPLPLFVYLSFLLVSTTLLSVWVARRLVAPLARFAAAADRFGRDGTGEHLSEEGPVEVRRAASAFNRMRESIVRLIEDRTNVLLAISHDLRTPLTRLRLRLDEIAPSDSAPRQRMLADLETMESSIAAAVAYLREGATEEPLEKVDLPSILETICDRFGDAGQSVRYQGPPRLSVPCRPASLERAVTNLVDNAAKYGTQVVVELERSGNSVAIEVRDDGPGIPDAEKPKVVQPFYRSDAARQDVRGFGLGLAIVSSVVTAHRGTFALLDNVPTGLRARIVLPAI